MKYSKQTRAIAMLSIATLALTACGGGDNGNGDGSADGGTVTITITENSIAGGKSSAGAEWIADWVIPEFEKAQKEKGKDVKVKFEPQGVDDEAYKTKVALDLQSGKGADIVSLDGIWIGEFAQAGYIKPLSEVAPKSDEWEGWEQIPDAVQAAASFEDKRYGIPSGADGRVVYFNKELFKKAGLPEDWSPASWDDILSAARELKKIEGITPLQLNAGTAMGEATTMQGLLPMLAGTGQELWKDDKWSGDSQGLRDVLELYKKIYVDEGLGDPVLQQEASGRDTSFAEFADGKIGILLEGDYFWRSVINPEKGVGTAPMENRDEIVGYVKIPAMKAGAGVKGQDFVSMSGGSARVLNPGTKQPELALELLEFMNSVEAYNAHDKGTLGITPRKDVNVELLKSDPMLQFVNDEVLPITFYRPGLAEYPEVSVLLQQATLDVISGSSIDDVVKAYDEGLKNVVGAENVG